MLALTGLALGISVIIPGLSAGTMAVVFNVYDRLIGVITPNIKKIIAEWKFWLPLVIGGGAGILFFSKLVSYLYANQPALTVWFFTGVIAGSVPMIFNRMCGGPLAGGGGKSCVMRRLPPLPAAICAALAFALMAAVAVARPTEDTALYTELTLKLAGMLVLSGVLSATAMIIPGISGSFLLLVIGLYRTVLQAVSGLNIPLLAPFAVGAAAGIFLSAALVRFLLAKAPRQTYGAVLGLVSGSIIVLFPGFGSGVTVVFSVICFLCGAALSFFPGRRKKIV